MTLDNAIFPNAEFLKRFALRWHSENPRKVREINTKRDWTFREEDEYYNFKEDKEIEFDEPFGLNISIRENNILFWAPPYRYGYWFEMDADVHRDEWRKYM